MTRPANGHIGRIVAGSLVGGLTVAVLLVAFPFAGAPEHVVAGSVLLAFASAWAVLAWLSARWTDQPQRWAIVPAAFMAGCGAIILALGPTGNELGWVWPPVVAALAVWMVARARRDLHSRARVWMVYPVCAALLLSAVGGAYETYREAADAADYPMAGRLVDVGGHRLHIHCTGSGSPTVVLEPGLGDTSSGMAWIAPDVATTTRVCVYDRAGRGWSESASGPQDGNQTATALHTLLERAGEPGPYVLAGHSAGGLYVMSFARLYPDQVAGVVLLDSMHPDQYTKLPSYASFYGNLHRAVGVLPPLARLGVGRLVYGTAFASLPSQARDEQRALQSTPRANRSLRDEVVELRTAMAQARALTSLGNRPLFVLTTQKGAQRGWAKLQNDLTTLSTDVVHRVLPAASHSMLTEDEHVAARSSRAITRVVDAVRSGTPLAQH